MLNFKSIFFLVLFPICVYSGQVLDKVVAVVNEDVITASELEKQVDVTRHELEAKRMPLPEDKILRKQVLKHLIDVSIQLQIAKRNAITVDSSDLNATIERIATSNKLTLTQLREALEKSGMSWEAYQENIRKEMLMGKIQQQAVGSDIVVSSQQVEDYMKTAQFDEKEKQLYHLKNIVIPLPEKPTAEQLRAAESKANALLEKLKKGADFSLIAVEESSGEYALEGGDLGERHLAQLPEVFAKKAVHMKLGEVVGPLRVENGFQLIKLVEIAGNEEHHDVIKTHVRHILIKQTANMTKEDAKKQIFNLRQQLNSGKDFALMAKQYSLDAGSAKEGGDLGWVTGDELVPQFSEAMEKLPLHTISQPIESPFGWHLIEVLERKKVDDTGAYKRQQIKKFLTERKFNEQVQNWQQHLRADAYVNILEKALA